MAVKKLTLASIKKGSSKLNEKITVQITDTFGETYEIIINKYFKKTDIALLLGEYVSITQQLDANNSNIELNEAQSMLENTYLFTILIIKYMSNIPIPEGLDAIPYVTELINLGLLDQIIKSIPQEEKIKVSEWINEMGDYFPKVVGEIVNSDTIFKNISSQEQVVE